MAYATTSDMVSAFGEAEMQQLTDIVEPLQGTVNLDVLGRRLGDASALIDGYLVGRYNLPLDPVPDALRVHCCGMARYLLMANTPDERAKSDYKTTMDYLQRVAAGTIALQPPSAAGQVPAGMGPVFFSGGERVFARENG